MTAFAPFAPAPTAPSEGASIGTLYRQMWTYAKGARGWMVLSSGMLVASQLVKLLAPWLTAKAIETLQGAGGAPACVPWVAAIFGVYAVCWALHGPGRVIERRVSLRVRRVLTERLYTQLSGASLTWHGQHHPAELAHRMTQSTQALANFTQSQFIYLQNAVNLVGPLAALWMLSHLTGAATLVGMVAVALTIAAFDRAMIRLAHEENIAERRHAAAVLDCLSNIATVLSLRLQETTRRLLTRRLDAVVAPVARGISLAEWKWCAVDLLGTLLTWGLVALYAWQARSGTAALLGGLFMVHQYAQQSGSVIGSLASNLQSFARMRIDFASAAPIWAASRSPCAAPGPSAGWQYIDLCDLCYSHPQAAADPPIPRSGLRHVSLRLYAGERVALVGPSGSGKSTLLRLMAGLAEPSHGHIEIDGVATLGLRDLGRGATLIPQEAQVFEASVRENIGFDLGHDDAELQAAAYVASFDAVLDDMPLGLSTPVLQAGANLSGGQRQRLCLARGVLAARGSAVLLLDEPTSALDPLTEALVHDRLSAAFAGTCVVASVHRMSLLDRFDRVVLLVEGTVVDSGSVADLLERQPLFREMVGTQAEREPGFAVEAAESK